MPTACTHADLIKDVEPSADGCEDCLAVGGRWVHLRLCLTCGHVGCCDSSPAKHATAHYHTDNHPLVQSYEPGEEWSWCYIDEIAFLLAGIRGTTRIPPSRIDWQQSVMRKIARRLRDCSMPLCKQRNKSSRLQLTTCASCLKILCLVKIVF